MGPAPKADLRQGNMSAASLPSTVLEAFEDNLMVYIISGCITGIALIILLVIVISLRISRSKSVKPKRDLIKEISSPTLIHSSSTIPGILKDSSHLSVLPKGSPEALHGHLGGLRLLSSWRGGRQCERIL